MIIRIDTGSSAGTFAAEQTLSATQGETTTPVTGVGDAAYSLMVSGRLHHQHVRRPEGSSEVQVNGPGTPAQVQAYATQLVDKL